MLRVVYLTILEDKYNKYSFQESRLLMKPSSEAPKQLNNGIARPRLGTMDIELSHLVSISDCILQPKRDLIIIPRTQWGQRMGIGIVVCWIPVIPGLLDRHVICRPLFAVLDNRETVG